MPVPHFHSFINKCELLFPIAGRHDVCYRHKRYQTIVSSPFPTITKFLSNYLEISMRREVSLHQLCLSSGSLLCWHADHSAVVIGSPGLVELASFHSIHMEFWYFYDVHVDTMMYCMLPRCTLMIPWCTACCNSPISDMVGIHFFGCLHINYYPY